MQIPGWQVIGMDLTLVPEALCETWPRVDFASPSYRKYLSRIRWYSGGLSLSTGRPHDPHDRISRDGFRFLGETAGHGRRPRKRAVRSVEASRRGQYGAVKPLISAG
jgi:hypothetical protein